MNFETCEVWIPSLHDPEYLYVAADEFAKGMVAIELCVWHRELVEMIQVPLWRLVEVCLDRGMLSSKRWLVLGEILEDTAKFVPNVNVGDCPYLPSVWSARPWLPIDTES